jgi:SRSO17 transposase
MLRSAMPSKGHTPQHSKFRCSKPKAGVPKEISFKTKPQIALEQLRWACEVGLPRGVALLDAGYGANTDLRANITTLGLWYVAGIMPNTTIWRQAQGRRRRRNGRAADDRRS